MGKLALHGGTPVIDQSRPTWPVRDEREEEAVLRVVRSGAWQYGYGREGAQFEEEFAEWVGSPHALVTINGTETMTLALKAAGIGPGDEVIMPTQTFIACPLSVLNAQAIPVLCDIDPRTLTMDPSAVEAAVTENTRAIMAVSLYGVPPDMDALGAIAEKHGLILLEDVAQAQGTQWRGQNVGTLGDFGSFSFQTAKAMISGDGGAVTCRDDAHADYVRAYRLFGMPLDAYAHDHAVTGGNYRISELQSALLRVQLTRVEDLLERKQHAVDRLADAIADIPGLSTLHHDERVTRVNYVRWTMVYDADKMQGVPRARFLEALSAEGLPLHTGYAVLIHEQPLLDRARLRPRDRQRFFGREIDYPSLRFPAAERARDHTTIRMIQDWLLADDDLLDKMAAALQKVAGRLDELT